MTERKPERARLFAAVSVPARQLDELEVSTEPLRSAFEEARWTPKEKQHITLKFFGYAPLTSIAAIADACSRVASSTDGGSVRLAGFGAFPTQKRARVLWTGIEDDDGLLTTLAGALDDELEPLGIMREQRGFNAHLTLARFREPRSVKTILEHVGYRSKEAFEVSSFELFRSHLSPKGSRYEVLHSYVLSEDRAP